MKGIKWECPYCKVHIRWNALMYLHVLGLRCTRDAFDVFVIWNAILI